LIEASTNFESLKNHESGDHASGIYGENSPISAASVGYGNGFVWVSDELNG
jgi:hypothetical protein